MRAEHGSLSRYGRGCRCLDCKDAHRVSRALSQDRDPYAIPTGREECALDPSDAIDLIAECLGQS